MITGAKLKTGSIILKIVSWNLLILVLIRLLYPLITITSGLGLEGQYYENLRAILYIIFITIHCGLNYLLTQRYNRMTVVISTLIILIAQFVLLFIEHF